MKLLSAVSVLLLTWSTFSFATSLSLCKTQMDLAQTAVKRTEASFEVGEATRLDIAQATVNLLELRFDCRDLNFTQYCADGAPLYQQLVDGRTQEAQNGQANYRLVDELSLKQAEFQAMCQ